MRTIAFCESDPFCRAVLRRRWPHVPCWDDVRTLDAHRLGTAGLAVDVICGGFPCEDVSIAGRGAGLDGPRSGLWKEFARLVRELRPEFVLVENVAALLGRGLGRVLGDLAQIGYDAQWHCIPAAAVGAPHLRDRIWIVAYPDGRGWEGFRLAQHGGEQGALWGEPDRRGARRRRARSQVGEPGGQRLALGPGTLGQWAHAATTGAGWWAAEPGICRVVDGPAARVDRRRRLVALGGSLVPDIPEIIGTAIMRSQT